MMRLKFVSLFVMLSTFLFSQDPQFRVISCSGDIQHVVNDQKSQVSPGNKISPEGTLVLKEEAKIKLICKDTPYTIEKPGEYKLDELYNGSVQKSMSFTGKFWNFIMDGLKKSDSDKELKQYQKEYLSVQGGVKGYAEGSTWQLITPIQGKVSSNNIILKWKKESRNEGIKVSILSKDDYYKVCDIDAEDTQIQFSASDCNLVLGNSYYIVFEDASEKRVEYEMSYVEIDQDKIERRLNSLIDFNKADEREREWMKAVIFEMESFNYEANLIYKKLISEFPNDGFIRKMHLLFLIRNNISINEI